ncbi:lytic polysaccharide monooxygenase [Peniophora sp. CONT]|nr:lytic polysaccharide monooxygenase [Peniophora sp. CONT]
MLLFTAVALSLLAPSVVAHGWLSYIIVDGTKYAGLPDRADLKSTPGPPSGNNDTVIRQIEDVSPILVKDLQSPDMACGLSATPAPKQANARPGSKIDFLWVSRGPQNWIHKVGPVMTYLAECTGAPDCSTFDASKAQWFKIDQQGLSSKASGTWWVENFFNGKPLSVTLPSDIKAGNYLFRNEIIALHSGAEFYPACAQLSISGSKTGTPNATVSFPGAYIATDPGILDPHIYDTPVNYTFPGGPVSNIRAITDSAGGQDLDAPTTEAHSSNATSSGGSNSTAPTESQSAESQLSADGTATTPSTESPATAATTTPADENTDALASPTTTSGSAAGQTTCASTAALAQRKRMVDRSGRAVAAVRELRMARAPRRGTWHW